MTDKVQELFLRNKHNANLMCVVDTILVAAAEVGIDENWCLLNNKSTRNDFNNRK